MFVMLQNIISLVSNIITLFVMNFFECFKKRLFKLLIFKLEIGVNYIKSNELFIQTKFSVVLLKISGLGML